MNRNLLRPLIIVIVLGLALGSLGVSNAPRASAEFNSAQSKAAQGPCPSVEEVNADAALEKLKAGNLRWQSKMEERNWAGERKETAECGQHPFAVVIACMDSRVPPELIFDRGLGEIFVVRVAGPVLNRDELASLEYALVQKHVKLVVVLGHTDCGAVRGAVDRVSGTYLPSLFYKLEPAIRYVSARYNGGVRITSKQEKDLNRVSIANARFVHSDILRKPALREPGVRIKWGLYYLGSGKVDFDPKDVEP